jgi:putative phage-type endonuclease
MYTDYISIFHLLNDYDNLIELCKMRLIEVLQFHIHEFQNDKIDELILEYTHEQVMNDLKPIITDFISILSNKPHTQVSGIDYLEHYNTISDSISECIEHTLDELYESKLFIRREYEHEFTTDLFKRKIEYIEYIKFVEEQIKYLQNIPQPQQRTQEWYEFRHNCITASSAWKILDTPKQQENFIKSKIIDNTQNQACFNVNITSSFHHGHKYEPLSSMIYEHINNTTIGEFGCIKHTKYAFLGASPDGININKQSHKYGTLLEIKNVVSREISGIPKKEYWIQMQLQMEVCDLDYCDFLETKFIEYESEDHFINDYQYNNNDNIDNINNSDNNTKIMKNKQNEYIGLIVMFYINNEPYYEYCPLNKTTIQDVMLWKEYIINKYSNDNNSSWVQNIYWKCEVYNCICVERNKKWFENIFQQFEKIWNKIISIRNNENEKHIICNINTNNNTKSYKKNSNKNTTNDIFDKGNIGVCLIKLDL